MVPLRSPLLVRSGRRWTVPVVPSVDHAVVDPLGDEDGPSTEDNRPRRGDREDDCARKGPNEVAELEAERVGGRRRGDQGEGRDGGEEDGEREIARERRVSRRHWSSSESKCSLSLSSAVSVCEKRASERWPRSLSRHDAPTRSIQRLESALRKLAGLHTQIE